MPFSPEQRAVYDRLDEIFFNRAQRRLETLVCGDRRLAHYTTAESAIKIIRSRTFWMRDTRGMTDFREVQHGYDLLVSWFKQGDNRARFCAALDTCFAGCGMDALKRFDEWWAHIQSASYICCFSEHEPTVDNRYGRLSMWRAYGLKPGVAIILRPPAKYTAVPLSVFMSPVAYFGEEHLSGEIEAAMGRITSDHKLITTQPRELITFVAYRMLVMAALSLKHPAFEEEREWRLIHLPFEQRSQHVEHAVETIGGVPQIVYKVPLRNAPEAEINGISLPELLDRIIIGPTQYPGPIYASLVEELTGAGVPNAATKVFYSGVPLRT